MDTRIGVERVNHSDKGSGIVLELCTLDDAASPPAEITEQPQWERVYVALKNAFEYGGFVDLKVLAPKSSFVNELNMKSLPGQYRLVVLTRSNDPKAELLEWWEQGDSPFRGGVALVMTIGMQGQYVPTFLLRWKFLENSSTLVIYLSGYCKCDLSGIRSHSPNCELRSRRKCSEFNISYRSVESTP